MLVDRFTSRLCAIAIVGAATIAHADPADDPPPDEPIITSAPGDESGRIDTPEQDSPTRMMVRGLLFVPRMALRLVLLPVRGAVYLYDRYQIGPLYYSTFYNADRTLGIIPTAAFTTGLGFEAGAQLISTNTFGRSERLVVAGTWGGTYRLSGNAWIDTGDRLGRFKIQVGGNFNRQPDQPFWGIGNQDKGPQLLMPVNPQNPPDAVESFFRYQEARAMVTVGASIYDGLAAFVRGSYLNLKYANSTNRNPPVDMVYNTSELSGFDTGASHVYGEGELRWDTRQNVSAWEPIDVHATGALVDGFGGYSHGLDNTASFWHYGVDLQQYFRIASGPRTLMLRFFGEAVSGSVNEVPFTELPYLGGDFLRGYSYARFRDRIAAFGTVQYFWDISQYADAYVFTDFGRVYSSYSDLTLSDLRLGGGVGVEVHSANGYLFEGYIGSSIDGGVVVSAAFAPIYDQRPRWR